MEKKLLSGISRSLLLGACIFYSCGSQQNSNIANDITFARILQQAAPENFKCLPKPHMWEPMAIGIDRKDSFLANKHQRLTTFIHKEETKEIFYDQVAFTEMINHFENDLSYSFLQIFIASYQGTEQVPAGEENKLVLIFVPCAGNKKLGSFIIPPGATHFDHTSTAFRLDNSIAASWVGNYRRKVDGKMGVLLTTIIQTDPENTSQMEEPGQVFDTKRIWYPSSYFKELVAEMAYQEHCNKIPVSGITAQFAEYGPAGREANDADHGKYRKRLIVQFELVKRNSANQNEIFYIDTTSNSSCTFMQRPDADASTYNKSGLSYEIKSLDKGQLCPANCP